MSREIIRTKNFAVDAAEFLRREARRALAESDEFRIALSGGTTPRPVYAEFARRGEDLPWEQIIFTFSDERCVPPNDLQSNFHMANESLFASVAVPEKSILRLRGEIEPILAAQAYQDELDRLATARGEAIYRHDVLLLGLGDDGHTASLFPHTAAIEEKTKRVAANFVPKLKAWRLTYTYPLIAQARQVVFLVNANKAPALLERVLDGDQELPAARVVAEKVTWILGEAG